MKRLTLFAICILVIAALTTLVSYDMFVDVMTRMALLWAMGLGWMSLGYVVARRLRRLDIVDTMWGGAFVVMIVGGLLLQRGRIEEFDVQLLVTVMVVLWGARLMWHIGRRFARSSRQDARYTELTNDWKDALGLRAFVSIFVLQSFLALMIAIPVIHIVLSENQSFTIWTAIGFVVWLFGLIVEIIADHQLRVFMQSPKNKGKLLTTGLRAWSRNPSYFGETCVWWGFAVMALGTQHGWVGLIGALTITYLLMYVTGVPLAEKNAATKPGWKEYAERTSRLVPLPPRN